MDATLLKVLEIAGCVVVLGVLVYFLTKKSATPKTAAAPVTKAAAPTTAVPAAKPVVEPAAPTTAQEPKDPPGKTK